MNAGLSGVALTNAGGPLNVCSRMTSRSSESISRRALKHIPGGVNSPVRAFRNVEGEPFFVDRGEGARIYDVDGNDYIDYVGSWGLRSSVTHRK